MINHYLKILTVLLITIASIGCDSQSKISSSLIGSKKHNSTWERIADNSRLKTYNLNPRVQYFIKQYSANNGSKLVQNSVGASPYIYHIVSMLEERGMPIELALLPIVESEYKPSATSKMGASGLWQITSATGRIHGLKQDSWYDGRKDVNAATAAALNHLQALYIQFNHDWLLALAAYNAGGGRVEAAIKANKKLGKPTDYWSLSLPKETQYYVPKFLAVAHLVKHSRMLGFDLAHVPNKPYFTQVKLEAQADLNTVAKMAELEVAELKKLNPAHRSNLTDPAGPHQILLPIKHASIFKANMIIKHKTKTTAPVKAKPKVRAKVIQAAATKNEIVRADSSAVQHVVGTGDTLHTIASKYKTSIRAIMQKNKLKSDIIRHGQRLDI